MPGEGSGDRGQWTVLGTYRRMFCGAKVRQINFIFLIENLILNDLLAVAVDSFLWGMLFGKDGSNICHKNVTFGIKF